MIELIGLVVVVVFGYSVVQGYKRGNVSEEEKKQNPTLVESLGEAIDSVHKYSEQYEAKAKLEVDHFSWFKRFNRSVLSALEHAEFMEDHHLELDKDPELRSLFEDSLAEYQANSPKSVSDQRKNITEQIWYNGGIPAEPDVVSDPEVNLWLKRSYSNHLLEHQRLVKRVRERISSSSRIDGFFRDALSERNLTKLYLDFFRQENEPRNSYLARSQLKASEPNSQPSFPIVNDLSQLGNLPPDTKADLVSDHEEDSLCINDDLKKYLDNAPDRLVDPPIEELNKLPTPLEPGERKVLAFFLDCLGPDWEIYVQPHLNGLRPDFVLLNPMVGIGVFEVKNWNFGAVEYFPKSVANGRVELWGRVGGKEFSKEHDNPFRKIVIYKQEIFDIYCPRLKSKAGFAAITGGVIFPSAPTKEVRALQKAFLRDSESKTSSVYLPVCGREDLFAKDLQKIFPNPHASVRI